MIYLDYSATTKPNKEVLDTFIKSSDYFGNPNSLHKLGLESKKLIEASTNQIANLLKIKPSEIIYTSGSSEANNTVIKGIVEEYPNRGKHIITTNLEHSSIDEPLNELKNKGYIIDIVKLNKDGTIDLDDLERLLSDDTILVTISSVSSEIGIRQPINEIGEIVKKYKKCFYHVDMTQSIGKEKVSFDNIDFASFSAHKFYGIKGIGVLYKKENIIIKSLINGGKSTTIYRSGTPCTELIASIAKALRLIYQDLDKKIEYVNNLNIYLKEKLKSIPNIHINSTDKSISNIINISIVGIKPETMLHALEEEDIYISTKTACSSDKSISKAVYELYKDEELAKSSLRISLSYLTTKEELDRFIEVLKIKIGELSM